MMGEYIDQILKRTETTVLGGPSLEIEKSLVKLAGILI